jgi:hypothetical protein
MLDEIVFLIALFLLTCVNIPMVLVYLLRQEQLRRDEERRQQRLNARA